MSVSVRRNSNPFQTPQSVARRRNSTAMLVDAVANTVPYGPQAVRAARIIQGAYRAYQAYRGNRGNGIGMRRNPKNTQSIKGLSSKWSRNSTGYSAGKFKKPKKTKNPKIETLCLKRGYHVTKETSGKVEDPHCAYLLHSTFDLESISIAIAGSLLRKLFKKGGYQMDNAQQEVVGTAWNNAEGLVLEYVVYNPSNAIPIPYGTYTTVDNDNLELIINTKFPTLKNHISNFLKNDHSFDDYKAEPYSLNLYVYDGNAQVADSKRLKASLNLVNETIYLYSSSSMKIQNRSAGDTAGTLSDKRQLDVVDNQPLKGYVYHFNGEPRQKFPRIAQAGVDQINYCVDDGLTLFRANILPHYFNEPPVPKFWANCNKSNTIRIQPGEMKNGYIAVKYVGKMTNLLKKLRAERIQDGRVTGMKGKTQMYCLEEVIRTAASNPITIQYECEMKIGCWTKSGVTAPLQSQLITNSRSAIP